jgi:hypothetical protein
MAGELHRVGVDLANVFDGSCRFLTTLAWGDDVEVVERTPQRATVKVPMLVPDNGSFTPGFRTGFIRKPTAKTLLPVGPAAPKVLKVDVVDVQQGDAALLETPDGKTVLVDGGENRLFARYLAARFRGSSAAASRVVDCIVVSHGDADHFSGLVEIHKSETHSNHSKRLFLRPQRVFHNGLVKRPGSVKELEMLGPTRQVDGSPVVVDLVDDLLAVPPSQMNTPFRAWRKALEAFRARGPIELRRLAEGDHDAFDFLRDGGVEVKVLGPIVTDADGVAGLAFLRQPPARVGRQPGPARFGAFSASHTINGHSVILHVTFGGMRFLFAGDLNEEAEHALVEAHDEGRIDLTAEILKVPHHGSADYSSEFLSRVSPIVSIVSAGDEHERKEYMHPRANLMAALGRCSRPGVDDPLIFVTELAAFFKVEGYVTPHPDFVGGPDQTKRRRSFFAFSRSAFGLVRLRTDGARLLVYTYSGKDDMKEAYAFKLSGGVPVGDKVTKV